MQLANILLSLGGHAGNQVPKFGVTAAEVAVLIAIHGDGSVTDIEPAGEVKRAHREELGRLTQLYGKLRDGKDESAVGRLFPGAAARVFETLDELGIPAELYKAKTRVTAQDEPAPRAAPAAIEQPKVEEPAPVPQTAGEKRAATRAANKAAKDAEIKAAKPEPTLAPVPADEPDEADGIGDMPSDGGVLD